jgi:hypothetical protein
MVASGSILEYSLLQHAFNLRLMILVLELIAALDNGLVGRLKRKYLERACILSSLDPKLQLLDGPLAFEDLCPLCEPHRDTLSICPFVSKWRDEQRFLLSIPTQNTQLVLVVEKDRCLQAV